jgi:transcriptional regulator GlxA family with amidase domain
MPAALRGCRAWRILARMFSPDAPRLVVFALYPGFVALDLAGPLDVFQAANQFLAEHARPSAYAFRFAAQRPGPVPSGSGPAMLADAAADGLAPHTLLIPGSAAIAREAPAPEAVALVAGLAARAERVVSVCTGALLLAACGLLDGRRATTHWSAADALARRHPAVRVEADALFVRDGHVHTSAGVTAGIDLALDIVERDLGPEAAMAAARLLVVYRRRAGSQAQFSEPLRAQQRAGARFAGLHAWMETRLAEDLRVERLAERAGMSARNFARVFKAETGATPARYVEELRLGRARELLEAGETHLQTVAHASGFGGDEQLRRAFLRRLGVLPSRYAEHFAAPPAQAD